MALALGHLAQPSAPAPQSLTEDFRRRTLASPATAEESPPSR